MVAPFTGTGGSGEAIIRGIDIDKLAKGFADEDIIFKRFVTVTNTKAREIRWYQKPSGILSLTAPSFIDNVAELAQPDVLEQRWTRQTSYVRKYFVESPMISYEDIKDSDPDVLGGNIHDLTRAVAFKVDERIWDVLSDGQTSVSNINFIDCSGAWTITGGSGVRNPIADILRAKQKIREDGYNPEGATLFLNSISQMNLIDYLISEKGSSIPAFSSQKVVTGVVMEILGLNVVVSENVTSNFGLVAQGKRALTWKNFTPITARTVEEVGIGTKIRVWEEGEALLTDGNACCLLSGVGTT